jgi:hypothetical protein
MQLDAAAVREQEKQCQLVSLQWHQHLCSAFLRRAEAAVYSAGLGSSSRPAMLRPAFEAAQELLWGRMDPPLPEVDTSTQATMHSRQRIAAAAKRAVELHQTILRHDQETAELLQAFGSSRLDADMALRVCSEQFKALLAQQAQQHQQPASAPNLPALSSAMQTVIAAGQIAQRCANLAKQADALTAQVLSLSQAASAAWQSLQALGYRLLQPGPGVAAAAAAAGQAGPGAGQPGAEAGAAAADEEAAPHQRQLGEGRQHAQPRHSGRSQGLQQSKGRPSKRSRLSIGTEDMPTCLAAQQYKQQGGAADEVLVRQLSDSLSISSIREPPQHQCSPETATEGCIQVSQRPYSPTAGKPGVRPLSPHSVQYASAASGATAAAHQASPASSAHTPSRGGAAGAWISPGLDSPISDAASGPVSGPAQAAAAGQRCGAGPSRFRLQQRQAALQAAPPQLLQQPPEVSSCSQL